MEVQQNVCPESTIESAIQRNPPPRKVVPPVSNSNDKSLFKGESKLACESTIDSANRRGFLKKAALFGAAAAVGGTLLGSKIIPESSATSCTKGSSIHPESHVVYCCPTGIAIEGKTCSVAGVAGVAETGIGVEGTSISGVGVCGFSCSSYGVKGCSNDSAGVYGRSGFSYGVEGYSFESTGVYGHSHTSYGVQGKSCCSYGVEGCSPKSAGVYGSSCSSYGVQGYSPKCVGVYGSSECSYGVEGTTASSSAFAAGVLGVVSSSTPGAYSAGVRGVNEGTGGSGIGVYGSQNGYGWGVYGTSPKGAGVYGVSCCSVGVEGYSSSNFGVRGHSPNSVGVGGYSCKSVGVCAGSICSIGVCGSSLYDIGVRGLACGPSAIPIVATGAVCQTSHLQDWRNHCNATLAFVDAAGNISAKQITGYSPKSIGVYGSSCSSYGVLGYSPKSIGVYGRSLCHYGVVGYSCKEVGVAAGSCTGIGVEAFACGSGAIPIVARGASSQSANLQQWRNSSCTPLSVVNKCGWFGIGTCSPTTTLQVKGSIGAKVVTPSCSTYCVADNCFAVLVNASAAAKTVNLPKAIQGMILYIKNTGTDFAVTIKPKSGDTIEGASSKSLPKENGVQLIAGGNSPATWYIVSTSK